MFGASLNNIFHLSFLAYVFNFNIFLLCGENFVRMFQTYILLLDFYSNLNTVKQISLSIAPGSNLVTVTTLPAVTPLPEASVNPVQFTSTPTYFGSIPAERLQQENTPHILSNPSSPQSQSDDPLSPLTNLVSNSHYFEGDGGAKKIIHYICIMVA